jgi:ABC-2 type transport system ATP-binding protein
MLRLTEVRKRFGRVVALDGLSLEIEPGEVFGLLGPNGAGKTTAIAIAVGLVAPDSGLVTIRGAGDPGSGAARRLLGLAPQDLSIYGDLTAVENLLLFGGLYGLGRRERRARAGELLELVGLTDRARDRVAGFSGGMKRRLNLAAALVHRPRLILLDEPTAGVDPQSRNALIEIIRRLRGESVTVVYTTHYLDEAQRMCDRVAIVDRGRVVVVDAVGALLRRYAPAGVVGAADDGVEREPALAGAPGLESVFLEVTGRGLRD